MRRIPGLFRMFAVLSVVLVGADGEELAGTATTPEVRELRELRTLIEQQSKQLESLSQQVGMLRQAVQNQKRNPGPIVNPPPGLTESTPVEPTPEIPKAEPVDPGPHHVVAKGETLTSIAKQYNIPLAELQKANKIENDRKLQIGQTLKIPTKTPEASAEKKETP